MEALSIWFGAGFTFAVCLALGALLFGRTLKRWPERFVAGAALLQLAVFALCCVHLAYPFVFLLIGCVIIGLWLRQERPSLPALHISNYLLLLAFTVYFVLYFFNAMAPESSPDGTTYHLSFPARYLRDHGFQVVTWDIYASFSGGMEMLYLFAFAFGRHSAASMFHLIFLVALASEIVTYAKRAGFASRGLCAALVVFASPLAGKDATSAYNDIALACAAFTLFISLQAWDKERDNKLLIPIGLVSGFCYALKYTGGVAVLYSVAFVLWKSRKNKRLWGIIHPSVPVVSGALLMVLPWIVKNWIWVGNPFSPFFNSWFPNPYVTTAFEKDYRQYLRLYELKTLWRIPLAVTVSGELQGVLGPIFLLAPISLLALRRAEGRQLLLAAAVFSSTYFSNIGARFLLPALPFVSLALMLAVGNRWIATAIAMAHAVISWPAIVPRYALPGSWTIQELPLRYAMRFRPQREYLEAHLPQHRIDALIDRVTEPGATILTYDAIPEAYTSRRMLVEYESASNHEAALTLWTGFLREWRPNWRVGFSFPRQTLRAFRVVQLKDGRSQWRIHELRAFNGAAELPRAGWSATAVPFPWGSNKMLDGNPVTFWECGDPLSAGSFVEVRFVSPQSVDSVLLETSSNQPELRLALYGETEPGVWRRLSTDPDISAAVIPDLRQAAVEELKRQGIGYVLLFDTDDAAKAAREGPAATGLLEVGATDGARLYRLQ